MLPRGITGFRDIDEPELPRSDVETFCTHCFAVGRSVKGRVVIDAPDQPAARNFVTIALRTQSTSIAVLLNTHFPILGFAAQLARGQVVLRFIDTPELAEAFAAFGIYQIIGASDLDRQLTQEDCKLLSAVEQRQIEYWRPTRIGDVIFNFWD